MKKAKARAGSPARAGKAIRRGPGKTRSISYPKAAPEQPYVLREPTTGLYAAFSEHSPRTSARLTYERHATRFATSSDALVAASIAGLTNQPHELVRIDR